MSTVTKPIALKLSVLRRDGETRSPPEINDQYAQEYAYAMRGDGSLDITKVSPEALFAEVCYLDTEEQVQEITRRCLTGDEDPIAVPFIGWHPGVERYVWWGLARGPSISKRPAFAPYFEAQWEAGLPPVVAVQPRPLDVETTQPETEHPPFKTEEAMQRNFVSWLEEQGCSVEEQVRCDAGIADVVDQENCYELKLVAEESRSLFKAIGQAISYAACLNKKPVVVLNRPGRSGIVMAARAAGVRVMIFPERLEVGRNGSDNCN